MWMAARAEGTHRCRNSSTRISCFLPIPFDSVHLIAERARRIEFVDGVRHVDPLPCAECGDGTREWRVRNRMRGPGRHGNEAASELVVALRAAFEVRDSAFDAELDRLVVARLEVQAGNLFGRSPVPAPKRVAVEQIECRA